MAVRIVTDSTADLPPEMAAKLGIEVVPLYVHFGEETYRDSIDIQAEEFYQRLVTDPIFPRTAQPSGNDFAAAYHQVASEGDILSLHISAKSSGTYNSALQGRQECLDERAAKDEASVRIEIVDTQQVSMALGLLVTKAAEKAQAGASLDDLLSWVHGAIPRMRTFFVCQTLEYLAKGGRIGRAQAFVGSLLAVKPIIEFREGVVEPLERVRTFRKATERLAQLCLEQAAVEEAVTAYTTEAADAIALAKQLQDAFGLSSVNVARLGPVVGTHAGPGLVGAAVLRWEA